MTQEPFIALPPLGRARSLFAATMGALMIVALIAEPPPSDGRARDPWGHEYAYTSGGDRVYVMSLGPDGKANTADDLWSHQ